MTGTFDKRAELIAAVTNDMARLLKVAAMVRERACQPVPNVDPLSAAGRSAWHVSPQMQRQGLTAEIRSANAGAKRADEAFASFISKVTVNEAVDDWSETTLEVGDLEVDYDELRELSTQLQAETAAMQSLYSRIIDQN